MRYIRWLIYDILKRPSLYFFVFLAVFSIDRQNRYEYHTNELSPIYSDVHEYYRIIPDIVVNKGNTYAFYKTTMGMAIMYTPAFLAGHIIAHLTDVEPNGYTEPYRESLRWLSIVYVGLGLWFCRRSLLMFFDEVTTLFSLIGILFGTNLFFYTYGWGEMPHGYLFMLYAIFIYVSLKWLIDKNENLVLLIAFLAGFITLIRPTGILVLLFPALALLEHPGDLVDRLKYVFHAPLKLLLAVFLLALPMLVQMVYWKAHTGKFFYWSYHGERFFFDDPQIINFLFSYRKGWLLYTPYMILGLAGIVLSWWFFRKMFWAIGILFVLNLYILSSWWEWSYGGSFGSRAMVEFYAFLIFPAAVTIHWLLFNKRKFLIASRILLIICFWFFIKLNFWQTSLFRAKIIHWSGMNRETYWYIMKRDTFTREDYKYLYSAFREPDHDKMRRGERDF